MDFVINQLGIFFGMVAMDFVYAEWAKATNDRLAVKASNYAVAIILLSGYVVSSYVHDPYMLVPAAFGAWTGTYLSTKFDVLDWIRNGFRKPKAS